MDMKLYGDGIHDDTAGLQALINRTPGGVSLPSPQKCYLISKPLELPSDFELSLPRFAEVRLADGSNCLMLKNKPGADRNIAVRGGVWNFNNRGQAKNPYLFPDSSLGDYNGCEFEFDGVTGLMISDVTFKDPVIYAAMLDTVSFFTVENIVFDYNYGNPFPVNMDGIHCNGNCHHGSIRNLKGSCYDDLVALNADEGSDGPITDIDIDGIYCTDCHSAVRLLTVKNRVENIHIRNIFGTFYQYCVAFSKYYKGETTGYYDNITLDNLYVSKAERLPIYQKVGHLVYSLIWFENDTVVKNLVISGLHRKEYTTAVAAIATEPRARIRSLKLENVTTESFIDEKFPLIENCGRIDRLAAEDVSDAGGGVLLLNTGTIGESDL